MMEPLELRVSKIESKLPEILQRVNAFDQMLKEIQDFLSKHGGIKNTVDNLSLQFAESFKELYAIKEEIRKLNVAKTNLQVEVSSFVTKHEKDKKDSQALHDSNMKDIWLQQSHVSDEIAKVAKVANDASKDVETLSKNISQHDNDFNYLFGVVGKNDEMLKKSQESLQMLGQLLNDIRDKSIAAVADSQNKWDAFLAEMAKVKQGFEYRIDQAIQGVKNATQSQLDAISTKIVPVDLSAVKKEIEGNLTRLIEAQGLDVRNANLKISNTAMQIQIFEKRLENITLLLKKFELSQ